MSKYEDPTQLDYRYGGDTVDDFAQKYMKTVAYIFSALNELRSPTGGTLTQNPEAYQLKVDDNKLYIRNQANTDWILLGDVQENFGFRTSASDAFMHESDVADSGTAGKLIRADASGKLNADILGNAAKIADKAIQMGLDLADEDRLVYDKDTDTITNRPLQFKVDGDKIYARKDATTGWVLLGDLKQNLGFRSSTDDAFLTESDVADNGTAGKLIRADVNGKLNADILGNARKMAGKTFAPEDLQDGQIPVYRTSDGTWHAENKGTVGTGKNLMIMDGDKMLGEYNGDEMKAIDIQKSSLTKALAESTGYGIVSGCEPSINGLTVTVSAGVIHTADGRRVEVPEQSITLDAADATKPRTDVVYLDKYGKIAKLTGEIGTPAVAGSNTYTISMNFAAGDTVTFGGVTFTCTSSTQDATNFVLGADTATSATNLATALNANSSINAIYTASTSGSVVTITEKSAGGGNTPGAMTTTGTGTVVAGTAVTSTAAASSAPTLTDSVIKVGEIAIKAGATSGTLITTHNHYKTATITYRNVETLRQDRTLMPGMAAYTLGYYAADDGGGAVYIVRSKTDADTDNGGSIIILDNGNVAELIPPEVVRAEIFGAHGDGVSDDSDALQKMLDYGGNIVLNKNKKYAFSTTLKISKFSNIDFSLAEMTYTGDDIGIIITGEGFASHKSDIGNITNIYLHAPNANKAISLRKCIKTRITNARIYDFGKIAVSIDVASYEAYLDDIRLVAKVKSGTVGFSGIASDMNFGSLYGLNVETFWSCNGGGYNVVFIHAWCANLNYFSEGLSTDEYNAWHANTSLLKIGVNTRAHDFFANFNYVYADSYHNVIYWDSYANNIKINNLGVYGCTKLVTFGGSVIDNTDTTPYIFYMHISNVTIDRTDLLTDESYYPNISFINGSESKKVINQDINGTTYQFVLNKLKMVVEKFTDTYTLALKKIERLPYYIGAGNYGTISTTRIPYFNETSGNYIYEIKNEGTTEKYIFIPIKIIARNLDTKFWYQV